MHSSPYRFDLDSMPSPSAAHNIQSRLETTKILNWEMLAQVVQHVDRYLEIANSQAQMYHLHLSVDPDAPHWPPRSPYEALLSSPNGRRKAQERQRFTSPSPSPSKVRQQVERTLPEDESEDEDEETLQLRLATLEARLKLKKLQAKKAKGDAIDIEEPLARTTGSPRKHRPALQSGKENDSAARIAESTKLFNEVQVPLSPERRPVATQEARSPGRILLGIDKGLTGKNVSLRRAPKMRTQTVIEDDPFGATLQLPNSNSRRSAAPISALSSRNGQSLPRSFSQRIADTRQQDKEDQDKKERSRRLRKQRSTGFGTKQQEIETFKHAADEHMEHSGALSTTQERGYSRDEVVKAFNKPTAGLVRRSDTVSRVRNTRQQEIQSSTISTSTTSRPTSSSSSQYTTSRTTAHGRVSPPAERPACPSPTKPPVDPGLFEPFCSLDLSKRILPHSFLKRTLESKTVVPISDLLRDIKSPSFSLPPALEENDFVVFGIIASKSAPLAHKDASRIAKDSSNSAGTQAVKSEMNVKGKYMVFTLTDLTWTLDLYLFTTAYTRFWKLTPGTLVAVLNPSIMPPPPGKADTGRWSLTLNSSDDTILEIGTARDLGFCKVTKKDGKQCTSWVNISKTEFCEWHVDRGVENMRRGRMEVQGMSAPFAPGGKRGGRSGFFGDGRRKGQQKTDADGLLKEGRQYDRHTQSAYFITPSVGGRSAASLLDADEEGAGRGLSKEELVRRRLAEREREKEIARQLGLGGNGTGAEYLRLATGDGLVRDSEQIDGSADGVDAETLGLLGNEARNVRLSPVKRKATDKDASMRKKTRFVTEKGIREAGRESFGNAVESPNIKRLVPSDDDDLDIV